MDNPLRGVTLQRGKPHAVSRVVADYPINEVITKATIPVKKDNRMIWAWRVLAIHFQISVAPESC